MPGKQLREFEINVLKLIFLNNRPEVDPHPQEEVEEAETKAGDLGAGERMEYVFKIIFF